MPLRRFTTFLVLVFAVSCEDSIQPPLPERIALTLVDVAVREVYLHVAVSAPAHNDTLILKRDGATIASFAAVAETTFADTGLTRATVYGYSAILVTGNEAGARSNAVSARTLSPASRDFTWQTFLFGDGDSFLYDVAIINDTLAYAVGEIYLRDSLGNLDPEAYNMLKWDGRSWQLLRVQFYVFCGQPGTWSSPTRAIFAFGTSDIWIAMAGSQVVRWNGGAQSAPTCMPISVKRLWGESPASMWAVGANGGIAHYDGATWERIESGSTADIGDVWGVVNPVTRSTEVYCAASPFFDPGNSSILRVTNGVLVDTLPREVRRDISSVWTGSGWPVYTAGSGVFENSRGRWREAPLMAIRTNRVRGESLADIFVAGDFGLVAHFDGIDWHVFTDVYNGGYAGVAVRGNTVMLVGQRNGRGVVTVGRR